MNIEELEAKFKPLVYPYIGSSFMTGTESPEVIKMNAKECTKLSIQFAIEVLEEVQRENELSFLEWDLDQYLSKKIQELKQYLDERNNN